MLYKIFFGLFQVFLSFIYIRKQNLKASSYLWRVFMKDLVSTFCNRIV